MVNPANAPAPTLLTNSNPTTTAPAPINPPSGAYQGIEPMPSAEGKGRGRHRNNTARNATTGRNDTRLASQGFPNELRSAAFIGGPQACNAPANKIIG
jgi:hypothetical protein